MSKRRLYPCGLQVHYYCEVRNIFVQFVAAGTATAPLKESMIEVSVAEWTEALLQTAMDWLEENGARYTLNTGGTGE